MNSFSLSQFADVLGLPQPERDAAFSNVAYDSRQVKPGDLFIALVGAHVDGHDFIAQAEANGASALLVSRPVESQLPCLQVDNVIQALGEFAYAWRKHFSTPIIAVTGSNGKTTTKNMIGSILAVACQYHENQVLVTAASNNTDLTFPIHLLRLSEEHQYAVMEMGMSHFGEIAYLSKLAEPAVAVITNAFPSHLAGVGGKVEGVAHAKGEIFEGLIEEGVVVLNRDDYFYHTWKQMAGNKKVLTFGEHAQAQVTAAQIEVKMNCTSFVLCTPLGNVDVQLPLLGAHNLRNALAAAAACVAVGVSLTDIQQGLEAVNPAYRRLCTHRLQDDMILIDDSYNANPASTRAAIDVLSMHQGEKILVLGDMKELGENEISYHNEIGQYAKQKKIDAILGHGQLVKETIAAFGEGGQHFESKDLLIEALASSLKPMMCVLIKGSRSMKMEEVVEYIILKVK